MPNTQDISDITWQEVTESEKKKKSWLPKFKLVTGVKNCSLSPESEPHEFFSLIFSQDLVQNLADWTNLRAKKKIDNAKRRRDCRITWSKVTLDGMNAFIGCLLCMGIVRMPSCKMYWQQKTKLFSVAGMREILSEQRFKDIYSCICFRNPSYDIEGGSKLSKIEPFKTAIMTNSLLHYLPSENLSIDESMISFSGRSKFKVFMPSKPIKVGLKAYLLCESNTGYVLNYSLHTGEMTKSEENSITYRIVMSLLEGFEGDGYKVFTDRFYTSMQLMADLKALRIGACGTCQVNRLHMSEELIKKLKDLEDREILYLQGPRTLFLSAWKDSRTVLMLSNYHRDDEEERERKLRKKDRTEDTAVDAKERVSIPKSIIDYTANMGGVDNFDQKSSNYSIQLRSHRWYIKVFFHFLEVSILNSYVIYTKVCQTHNFKKTLSHLEYRKRLIRSLVSKIRAEKHIESTIEKIAKSKSQVLNEEDNLSGIKKQLVFSPETNKATAKKVNLEKGMTSTAKKVTYRKLSTTTTSTTRTAKKGTTMKGSGAITRKFAVKRKAEKDLKSELENEIERCALQEIPKGDQKKTSKLRCEICRKGVKNQSDLTRIHQTNYWCSYHRLPVCLVGCYDKHLGEIRSLYNLKRRRFS